MATHVAILLRPYLRLVLDGRKTIESRLTMRPLPPYRRIATGDTIYMKASAGPYMARATAGRVEFFEGLTAAKVREIWRKHNRGICGDAEFWRAKKHSRYATLIWLKDVLPTDHGPAIAPSRGPAWFVLDNASESFTVTLTAGALRNRYVTLPAPIAAQLRGRRITLYLPDSRQLTTDLVGSRLRWRGWGPYFLRHGAHPGSRLRFSRVNFLTYAVAFPGSV